jgi:FemAB-related protein (PEP-CTERM system-associated)
MTGPTPVAPLIVRELTDADVARWDAFVFGCPEASFFHRAGWRQVLEGVYGHDAYYLYAEAGGRILGVLPLGHVRSRLFGNALMSTPFCVYGGIAAVDDEARTALERAAEALALRLRVDFLEMRNMHPRRADWCSKDLYVTFRRPIDPDPERNYLAIPRKQRAMVRKGMQAGLVAAPDEDLDRFHHIYAQSVHRLGTPVFPARHFEALKDVFGDDCELLCVSRHGRPVAGVLSFYFRDEVLPYYGGGTHEARGVAANDFMYWELMRRACERGLRVFDYGRSKRGSGSYSFKKNWGFEPQPLHYEYRLVRARRMPDVSPANPRYRLFINAWRRMPLGLTKLLGPRLARNLG